MAATVVDNGDGPEPVYDFSKAAPGASTAAPAAGSGEAAAEPVYDFSKAKTTLALPGVSEPVDDRPTTSDAYKPIYPVKPNEPWNEVLASAPANIPSSAARVVAGTRNGVVDTLAAGNPVGDMVGAYSGSKESASRLANNPLVRGAGTIAAAYQNPGSVIEGAKKAATDFGHKWFTSEGWKKNIGENPVETGLDLAPLGGAALRGVRGAAAMRGAELANDSRFAPMLSTALPGISPADLTPAHLDAIARNINVKGFTPAAVREAVMQQSTGVSPPRGAATGHAPVEGAEKSAETRSSAGAAAAGNRLQGMAGPAWQPTDLGQAWHDARTAAKTNTRTDYEAWRNQPGEFHPDAANELSEAAQQGAEGAHRHFGDMDYARNNPATATTQRALDDFHNQLANPLNGHFDLQHIDDARQQLRKSTKGESPADRRVVEAAITGMDSKLGQVVSDPTLFNNSANGPAIHQQLLDARSSHTHYQTHYGPDASPAVGRANGFLDASTGPDLHGAGTALESALINPRTGPGVYNHMASAGMAPTVDQYLRDSLLRGNSAKVDAMLASPVGQHVFSPEEQSQIRVTNASRKAFEAEHGEPAPSTVGEKIGSIAKPAIIGGLTGAATHYFSGNPLMAAGAGLLTGGGDILYNRMGSAARRELRGAPASFGYGAGNAAQFGADVGTAADLARSQEEHRGPPFRPTHARGGKVGGHQHLVDRLFTHVERAKKAEKGRTSVLLHQPDEHIAKALNAAQAAI
jgi:hypothetical protein